MRRLCASHVAVFGIGGVGGNAAEALVRAGIGELTVVDNDTVSPSNLNRQLVATQRTVGMLKTDALCERLMEINPQLKLHGVCMFFTAENADEPDFDSFDYIADAIDSVSSKLALIMLAMEKGIPIVSCMGAGNKLHPEMLEVSDIYQTSVCPLARVMRAELRKRSVDSLRVVWSREAPVKAPGGERVPGSTSFVPPAAGLIMAGEIIRSIAFG